MCLRWPRMDTSFSLELTWNLTAPIKGWSKVADFVLIPSLTARRRQIPLLFTMQRQSMKNAEWYLVPSVTLIAAEFNHVILRCQVWGDIHSSPVGESLHRESGALSVWNQLLFHIMWMSCCLTWEETAKGCAVEMIQPPTGLRSLHSCGGYSGRPN